jgi:carboxylesterase type B
LHGFGRLESASIVKADRLRQGFRRQTVRGFAIYGMTPAGAFFGIGVAAETLARTMMESWVAFATSTPATGQWPHYDAARRSTMILGDGAPHAIDAPNEERLRAWDAMPERRIGP